MGKIVERVACSSLLRLEQAGRAEPSRAEPSLMECEFSSQNAQTCRAERLRMEYYFHFNSYVNIRYVPGVTLLPKRTTLCVGNRSMTTTTAFVPLWSQTLKFPSVFLLCRFGLFVSQTNELTCLDTKRITHVRMYRENGEEKNFKDLY